MAQQYAPDDVVGRQLLRPDPARRRGRVRRAGSAAAAPASTSGRRRSGRDPCTDTGSGGGRGYRRRPEAAAGKVCAMSGPEIALLAVGVLAVIAVALGVVVLLRCRCAGCAPSSPPRCTTPDPRQPPTRASDRPVAPAADRVGRSVRPSSGEVGSASRAADAAGRRGRCCPPSSRSSRRRWPTRWCASRRSSYGVRRALRAGEPRPDRRPGPARPAPPATSCAAAPPGGPPRVVPITSVRPTDGTGLVSGRVMSRASGSPSAPVPGSTARSRRGGWPTGCRREGLATRSPRCGLGAACARRRRARGDDGARGRAARAARAAARTRAERPASPAGVAAATARPTRARHAARASPEGHR